MKKLDYKINPHYDHVAIETTGGGSGMATYDGKTITVTLTNITNKNGLALKNDYVETSVVDGKTIIKVKPTNLKGYYMETTAKGFDLIMLKSANKSNASNSKLPLKDYTILLDPGHGGSDSGARGLLGSSFTEKTINLNTALVLKSKLENLGATVKMTRESDVDMSLKARLEYSLKVKPDLFLSIHADSLNDTEDLSKVFGFSVFYKDPVAKSLSNSLLNQVLYDLSRKDRGANVKNFYVTRGTWSPSVLIETGFVGNPVEYEWLMDSKSQSLLADSLARGIVNYFGQSIQ